jgi:hypothetical protein
MYYSYPFFGWLALSSVALIVSLPHLIPSTLEKVRGTEQLVVTMSDETYAPFLVDWVQRLATLGTFRYIIEIGSDPICRRTCEDHHLSCTSITSDYITRSKGSQNITTRQMIVTSKTLLLSRTVDWGYDVFFTEIDVYWNKNIAQAFLADSSHGTDLVMSTHFTDPVPNSGAFFVRSNNRTAKLMSVWFEEMNKRPKACDQRLLSTLLGYPGLKSIKPLDRLLGLKHHMISNTTIVPYEQDLVFREVYKACAATTSSNFLLAGFHFTSLRLSSEGKKICLNEAYAGHFHNMICPIQGEKRGECEVALRWENDDPFRKAIGLSIRRRKKTPEEWARFEEGQQRRIRESWSNYYSNRHKD